MKKIGINIPLRDLDYYRRLNDQNTSKKVKQSTPNPNIFFTPIPDNRDFLLKKFTIKDEEKDDRDKIINELRKTINK